MSVPQTPCVGLCLVCGSPGVGKSTVLDALPRFFHSDVTMTLIKFDDVYRETSLAQLAEGGSAECVPIANFSPALWHQAQVSLQHRVTNELCKRFEEASTTSASSWVIVEDNFHLASMRKRFKTILSSTLSRGFLAISVVMCEVLIDAAPSIVKARNASRPSIARVPENVVDNVMRRIGADVCWADACDVRSERAGQAYRCVTTFEQLPIRGVLHSDEQLDSDDIAGLSSCLASWLRSLIHCNISWRPPPSGADVESASCEATQHRLDLQLRSVIHATMKALPRDVSTTEKKRLSLQLSSAKHQLLQTARQQSHRTHLGSASVASGVDATFWSALDDLELETMLVELLHRATQMSHS